MTILFILVILVLTYAAAYISCSEIAFFSLPSAKIKAYQYDKDPRKRQIAQLVIHSRDLIVTVFLLNTLINILLQNVLSHYFYDSGFLLKIGVPLFIILVFGEIIPKYIALSKNVQLAYWMAPAIDFFVRLFKPVCDLIVAVTTPISQVMFFFLKKEEEISAEELQHVISSSKESGILTQEEAELIDGFLNLQDLQVNEIMWPREDVLYYDINEPLSKLTYLFVDQECTRLPVCDKDLDHALGIITANEYFILRDKLQTPEDVKKFVDKPFYVPETTSAYKLIRRFEEKKETLALIVNEYGVISGLITSEDLVEEVVGEISDRRDQNPLYTRSGDNVVIASGKLELAELNEIFGVNLESPNNMLTIGGWLTEQLGDIPKIGKKFETNELLFQVLSAEPNRVKKIYIMKKGKR